MFFNGMFTSLSVVLIIIGISALFLFNYQSEIPEEIITTDEFAESSHNNIESEQTLEAVNDDSQKVEIITPVEKSKDKPKSRKKKKQAIQFDYSQTSNIVEGKSSLSVTENLVKKEINLNAGFSESEPDLSELTDVLVESNYLTPGDDSELLALNQLEVNNNHIEVDQYDSTVSDGEDIESNSGSRTSKPKIRSDYGKKGNLRLGAYFTPEMIFYPSSEDLNNRSYSVDVNAIYEFSGYLIQTGIGINWLSDDGNYKFDYNKYLGSYEDVYNVTFDTIGNEVIPTYHTETVDVYDTISHVSITPTNSNYTYLQIPVLFGYGHTGKRFGWSVKGGPSLSILVYEDIADMNMSDSQDKILNVDNELPNRISTNWQFVLAGGVSYKLSNHLSFAVEPVFRYYINSVYDNTANKNPYSLGLRAGFLVDF